MSVLSERLERTRQVRGLSHAQLAKKTGLQLSNLSAILHGKRRPGLDTLILLSRAMVVSIDWLVQEESVRKRSRE